RRQRVRRVDGRGPFLQPRGDHQRAVRGRRPVPPERVRLPFDPIEEAEGHWRRHGWDDSATGMSAVTSVMRAQQIFLGRVDDALKEYGLTFARYEALMLLAFSRT